MVDNTAEMSVRKQSELLSIHRSGLYFRPKEQSVLNLELMRLMDEHYLKHPAYGVLRMQDHLIDNGHQVNHKRVRRLMRVMGLEAIYPKRNLSALGSAKYIRPYLLRDLTIERPNHVWAMDITYIPMKNGSMYLTAIIDLYSRYVVNWGVSNSLEAAHCIEVLNGAVSKHGSPEIINSDQGSQFTSKDWIECVKGHKSKVSMDGKGRAIDNIYIERLWRSVKYEYVYLNPAMDGPELYSGLKQWFSHYNNHRRHQGIERELPVNRYRNAA
jgi:putative transposase